MKSVKIETQKLLEVLKANRETHINEFNSAIAEYRKEAIAEMKKNLKEAQNGGTIVLHIACIQPESYESHYNTAIKMLEMSSDQIVELSMMEFQQYVEDNWAWKHQFVASTALYNTKAK